MSLTLSDWPPQLQSVAPVCRGQPSRNRTSRLVERGGCVGSTRISVRPDPESNRQFIRRRRL